MVSKKKNSFTLIEVLVVIAIIAILTSAVLVYMKSNKEDAKIAGALKFRNSVNDVLGAYVVGAWTFESAILGYDSSGYKNNCTVNGGGTLTATSSVHRALGNALSIGNNSWLNCGSITSNSSLFPLDITMEAWAKAQTLYSQERGLVTNKRSDNNGINLYMSLSNIGSRIGKGSASEVLFTSWRPSARTWYYIVVTYYSKNNKAVLYVNGKIESETTLASAMQYSTTPSSYAGIGCGTKTNNTSNCGNNFLGTVDEVKIYNQPLSTAEIQQHYAEGLKRLELVGLK
jgi:prepilin-type N-terminal cleavage/methylation domain-containing protein